MFTHDQNIFTQNIQKTFFERLFVFYFSFFCIYFFCFHLFSFFDKTSNCTSFPFRRNDQWKEFLQQNYFIVHSNRRKLLSHPDLPFWLVHRLNRMFLQHLHVLILLQTKLIFLKHIYIEHSISWYLIFCIQNQMYY